MPYILTHASFAYTLGKRLGCFSTENERALYLLGSLGPDLYFFDRLPPTPFHPNQKKHGTLLHHVPCDALARAMLMRADAALFPYVLGFLTHIALDSTLHPYICSRYDGFDHSRFEGDIDAIVYRRMRDEVPFDGIFRMPDDPDALDRFLTDISREIVGAGVRGAVRRSLRKMFRLYPFLYDPEGKRLRRLSAIERVFGKEGAATGFLLAAQRSYFPDCMNESHTPWRSPCLPERERNKSVDELMAEAEALAERLLLAAMRNDIDEICALTQHRTMIGGLLV